MHVYVEDVYGSVSDALPVQSTLPVRGGAQKRLGISRTLQAGGEVRDRQNSAGWGWGGGGGRKGGVHRQTLPVRCEAQKRLGIGRTLQAGGGGGEEGRS